MFFLGSRARSYLPIATLECILSLACGDDADHAALTIHHPNVGEGAGVRGTADCLHNS